MHNIKTNFDKIYEVLRAILKDEVNEKGNYRRRGRVPKFSDIQVIALSLTTECLSIDSENYLFSKLTTEYQHQFEQLISRRQYNERKRLLFEKVEQVRKLLPARLNAQVDVFAIDSMPLEICKLSQQQRNKMSRESQHHQPDKGYCASQKKYFYGYKLHSVCSSAGMI